MLTFFRRVRKGLLGSGQARKYTLYAIGEVLLVVVDILIALQINNWNGERVEWKTEIILLQALQQEISSNIALLERRISQHSAAKEMTVGILVHFSEPSAAYDIEHLDSLVENATTPSSFDPQLGVVKSMISTGEVRFIENEEIVQFVTMFEDKIEEHEKDFDRLIEIWDRHLWPRENMYIRRLNRVQGSNNWFGFELPPSRGKSDYDSFFKDVILENNFMLTLYEQAALVRREEFLLEQMKDALALVNGELDVKERSH